MTGINFFVTILRCKTPTMKFMQMPMFTVTTFITTLIVILAFPVFTVVLALMTLTVYLELHSLQLPMAVCQCYGQTSSGYGAP